jgi:hypothetical protein
MRWEGKGGIEWGGTGRDRNHGMRWDRKGRDGPPGGRDKMECDGKGG